ncbi:sigma-w pathway protein ysdB [Bacillus tianshenii]|nr:sigma-w pathway protein ysdB [Bacillus tianshenii]
MFVILFRLFIIAAIIALIYTFTKYLLNPKRKLELAQERGTFYYLDDKSNVRKNLFITYKGVLFEGEKYLGTTERAFEVVSITIWPLHPDKLQGLSRDDFYFIEKELLIQYPEATIEWKSPVKEFLKTH